MKYITFGILVTILTFTSCKSESKVPVYNIPENFIGEFEINFNISKGYKPIYSEGYVTYFVPKSGILNTKTHDYVRLSHVDPIFYYIDSNGHQTKRIPFDLIPFSLENKNELRVFYHSHESDESDMYNINEKYVIDSTVNLPKYPIVHRAINRIDSLFGSD